MDLFDEYQTLSSLKRDGLSKPFLLGLYECAVSGKIYRSIKNTNVQSIVDVPWSSAMVVLLGEYTFLSQFDMEYGYSKKKTCHIFNHFFHGHFFTQWFLVSWYPCAQYYEPRWLPEVFHSHADILAWGARPNYRRHWTANQGSCYWWQFVVGSLGKTILSLTLS